MAELWLYIALMLNCVFLIASTESNPGNANSFANDETCTKELKKCSLHRPAGDSVIMQFGPNGDKGDLGNKGERGDQGFPGDQGEKGHKGYDGESGEKGCKGQIGGAGSKGEKGEPGQSGSPGQRGLPGIVGEKGERGKSGQNSPKGETGEQGSGGSPGPVGRAGISGLFPCSYPKGIKQSKDQYIHKKVEDIGNEHNPFNIVCKDVTVFNRNVPNTYDKVMKPEKIKVKCVIDAEKQIHTCITPRDDMLDLTTFSSNETGSWLSDKGLKIQKLYDLSREQIQWFHSHSDSAFQRIEYLSNSSIPYNASHPDDPLIMLSWNDITFGPNPNENTPLFYNVTSSINNFDGTGFAKITYLIKSDSAERLPVVDFYVANENEQKKIQIKNLELCFN